MRQVQLTRVAALNGGGAVSSYLGRLCWYTVPDSLRVPVSEVRDRFRQAGLPEEWLPKPIKACDAFRRACTMLARQRIPLGDPQGCTANILVREVCADERQIIRHLIWEVVDRANRRLSYSKHGEVVLDRAADTARAVSSPGAAPEVAAVCAEFPRIYRECLSNYDGGAIRRWAQAMMERLAATEVRSSGAVYFVPEYHSADLAAVGSFLRGVGAEYYEVPVVDTESTRDMVLKKFSEQVTAAIRSAAEALKDPEVTKGACLRELERAKELLKQIAEYRQLLEADLRELEEGVALLKAQAMSLVDRAGQLMLESA
ncbi:MAG: DUF6744 family protein [Bacillota bacterium]